MFKKIKLDIFPAVNLRIIGVFLMLFFVSGCAGYSARQGLPAEGRTVYLRDIAYDSSQKHTDYTVFVTENGINVPYLVLASDYDGGILVLRKYLLDETLPFNENERHMWAAYENGAYYENSSIDCFLNKEFITRFDEGIGKLIADTNIVITAQSSLGVTGEDTSIISRKVFLLSLTEQNAAQSYASVAEGKALKYFDDDFSRRTAGFSSGELCPHWTRTPETWETYKVFTIGEKGIGSGSADIKSGVRPAFCLDKSAVAVKRDGVWLLEG